MRSVLLLVVAGAAIGVWQGVAGASTKADGARNTIWANRDSCALAPHTHSIGEVRLSRAGGGRIYTRVSLVGAIPNATYYIYLEWKQTKSSSSCNEMTLGQLDTDSNGNAKGTFLSDPNTNKYFFINAFTDSCWCSSETDWMLL